MKKVYLLPLFAAILFMFSCGGDTKPVETEAPAVEEIADEEPVAEEASVGDLTNVGVGSVKELILPAEIDNALAEKGKDLFAGKGCTACHNPTMRIVGPALQGIFETRNPAWVMNMILDPERMVKEDPDAKALLEEYNNIPMTNQHVTEEEARAMVEYFRTI